MTTRTLRFHPHITIEGRWLVVAAWALASLLAWALTHDLGPAPASVEPPGFSLTPEGDRVPRLAPIRVTFPSRPPERDGARLVSLSPRVEGRYVWASDRTLIFQPDFPGLLRGFEYTVTVPGGQATGLAETVTRKFTVEGALTVDMVVPAPGDLDVPEGAQIYVQFSRSVAPLTLLSEQRETPVVAFDPPLEGSGEWLNTSLYHFVPTNLAPNTTYRAHIAAGLSSAADGVLKQDYEWSFTTYGPAVATVTPDRNTQFVGPKQPVVVTFNQAMDRPAVEAAFSLRRSSDGTRVTGSFVWSEDGKRVTLQPDAALPLSTGFALELPEGLAGANGGATRVAWTSTFTTAPAPAIVSTRPGDGATGAERYGIELRFASPMNLETFEGRVSVSGIPSDEIRLNLYDMEGQSLYVPATLKPSTAYTVTVAPGAEDRYGQAMGGYTFSFTTGALPSSVSLAIPGEVATYSASSEQILYFHATNVGGAQFTLWPLTADEARAIQSRNHIDPYPATFQPSLQSLRTWTESVSGAANEVVLASTSLSGSSEPLPKGSYLVRTSNAKFNSQLAFTVVDTVLIAKTSNDELLVWALDHDSGAPVTGAALEMSGTKVTTDSLGLARFAIGSRTPETFDKYSRSYLVTLEDGGHSGVTSTSWQNGIAPYELQLPVEYYTRTYVGHVYTDRPIYRPGETVHCKAVVRLDDDAAYSVPPSSVPLELVIRDAEGKELQRAAMTLNEFGSFAGSLTLPTTASIGDYGIAIERERTPTVPDVWVAGSAFVVAEFRKPEFQVEVEAPSPRYVDGDSASATAEASFFFGGAVPGATVDWNVLASPLALHVPGYEQYSFSDYDYWWARTAVVQNPMRAGGQTVTDASGASQFTFPAVLQGNEGAQTFQVSATVTDQSAQAVTGATTVEVHPGAYYAGLRTRQYVGKVGEEATVDLVTVDTGGTPVTRGGWVLQVYEREWVTTKEQTPEGARRYRSEPRDKLVETIASPATGGPEFTVTFTPVKPGLYRLVTEMADEQGRVAKAATYLWVSGSEYASWRVSNSDTIELVADKKKYEVGETAEILVPAPFEGATGLVTVERGKIISRETRQFATNSETIHVPIVDRDVPNVFVSVVLYRPPTEEDPVPRYKVGYVELSVSTKTRVLNVDIQPDREQAQPGDRVRYDIHVTDASGQGVRAELSAAVVDKAVLSLADERGPDGLAAFWFERGLGVWTASSLAVSVDRANDVISEPPQGGKGGGGFDDDRIRQDFRNTAYWEAQLVTDSDGRASVEVTMPDNVTTWRMQVRAMSGDSLVGEGLQELLSTQPLLLRPALPRFLRVGDLATLRLLVRNATDSATEVTASLEAAGVDLRGETSQRVAVEPRSSAIVEWPVEATSEGTARFTFRASGSNGLSDGVVQEIPVWLDVTPETTATGGIVGDVPMSEAVYLPHYAILEGGSLEVSVQPSLAGSLAAELADIELRPVSELQYEDTERIASRVIATAAVMRANAAANTSSAYLESRLDTDIAELATRQAIDGGWAWCRPGCTSDPNVTGWALTALGEAQALGRHVDPLTLNRATSYVFSYINRVSDVKSPADANQRAFLLYALARAGNDSQALPIARATVEQYRAKLNNWGRAYLVLAFDEAGVERGDRDMRALISDLFASTIPSANGNHWEDEKIGGSMHTDTRTTALVLQALVRAAPREPMVAQTARWLVIGRRAQRWQISIEKAQAILALSEFGIETGELGGDYAFRVTLDDGEVLSGRFKGTDPEPESTRIALSDIGAGSQKLLTFLRDAATKGRMYYTLNLRYLTPAQDVEALSRGFGISHEYTKLDNPSEPIEQAELGETIRVKVTVVAPADRNYVVVNDLLPAGLEPVDTSLKIVDPALRAQLEEERRKSAQENAPETYYFAPWMRWYFSPWQHVDIRDDRVTLQAQQLPKGVYEYIYYARATSVGDYFVAPAYAEETYFPETFGRSDSGRFTIEP